MISETGTYVDLTELLNNKLEKSWKYKIGTLLTLLHLIDFIKIIDKYR